MLNITDLKVYVINLDKDTSRLEKIYEQTDQLNINKPIRIPGIYGKKLSSKQLRENASNMYAKIGSRSSIGCAMSHIKAWKEIVNNNDKYALILEDDALFSQTFDRDLLEIVKNIPEDFGIVYFGCTNSCNINKRFGMDYPITKALIGQGKYSKKFVKINENIYVPPLPLALHAYVLSLDCAKYLIECVEKNLINGHIDAQILEYLCNVKSYAVHPELVSQRDVDIKTSNNVKNMYPSILNGMLSFKDQYGVPINYKLMIGHFDIFGYSINAYTYMIILIGLLTGINRIQSFKIFYCFFIFHLAEFAVNKNTPNNLFITNTLVSYSLLFVSYYIGRNSVIFIQGFS